MMLRNSSTSNSKLIKSIAFIVLIPIAICLIIKFLNYNYYQDDIWCRILWHNFYKSENIDNLYLGSSHVYHDIDPELMDELTGENNFNLSTQGQELIESYYLLREAIKENKLNHVYLELYYVESTGIAGDYSASETVKNMWRNTDNMKLSTNKIEAIWDENGKEHLIEALIPATRFRNYIFDYNYIKERHEEKNSDDFKAYQYSEEDESGDIYFTDKGFFYIEREFNNPVYEIERSQDEMFLTEDAKEYLRKICELCRKENITLTLFVSPMYELQMLAAPGYDNYRLEVEEIANNYGLEFYDFNLIKDEYLPIQDSKYYWDAGHLNAQGAQVFTKFMYELTNTDKYESGEVFYDSYVAKLEDMPRKTWGLYTETGEESTVYTIASTPLDGCEYMITNTPDGGKPVIIQDYNSNKIFELTNEGQGIITIATRFSDMTESIIEVQYAY